MEVEHSKTTHEPGKARIKSDFVVDVIQKAANPPESIKEGNKQIEPSLEKEKELEPPPKKKARGQNKNRPRTARDKKEDCLCPSLVSDEGKCLYGEKCKFLHDIGKYMSVKPPDLSTVCFSFTSYGKCNYGLSCRYGSCHIRHNEDGSYMSVVDEDKVTSCPAPKLQNNFPRELRIGLRKKKYSFPKSDRIFGKSKFGSKKGEKKINPVSTVSADDVTIKIDDLSKDDAVNLNISGDKPATDGPSEPSVDVSVISEDTKKSICCGSVTNADLTALKNGEKRTLKFDGKLFLAPLTTVGNLPFRVVCKSLGADITCGEMAMASCLLQGNVSEWALLKRHPCEDIFGVQICGSFTDTMSRCAELIENECEVDFIDINMGCPIDLVFNKGSGSALMQRTKRLFDIVKSMRKVMTIPLTCKMRTGVDTKKNNAHTIIPQLRDCGVSLCTVHGRSRQARYTRLADWGYVQSCADAAAPMPLFGNGDILSYEDYNNAVQNKKVSGVMIARGALIKPWIFTEIKEQRHWDISSTERFDILKKFVNNGLMHWGSDTRGVETTRRFLLEWLSFLHRYIPVGILEQPPQKINEKPPQYVGRNDLETLMADRNCNSWVKISEMLLGKVPDEFQFLPKHKANSYS